jgi:hypothetical protein
VTKCDLFSPEVVAKSLSIIDRDLGKIITDKVSNIQPIPNNNDKDNRIYDENDRVPENSQMKEVQNISNNQDDDEDVANHIISDRIDMETVLYIDEDDLLRDDPIPIKSHMNIDDNNLDKIDTNSIESFPFVTDNNIDNEQVFSSSRSQNEYHYESAKSEWESHLKHVIPVSAATGAGIRELWDFLVARTTETSRPPLESIHPNGEHSSNSNNIYPKSEGIKRIRVIQKLQKSLVGSKEDISLLMRPATNNIYDCVVREHYKASILRRRVS